eukprot:TRINITY_DN7732_c2_g1_i1.p1 TRINITY_DN7732_c2_g1~~TRINITY_DN7732_c2_g1_i1.p1  ORF type:complete len:315 (+),score=37.46 TRINITY_DN7732_c2_g1_i1:36-980(+)
MESSCYESQEIVSIVLGICLTLGTSISYQPQQIKICWNKTSAGLSPSFLFLSLMFSMFSLANVCLLQWDKFQCCRYITFWQCNEGLLVIYQIAAMPINVLIIYACAIPFYKVQVPHSMENETVEKIEAYKVSEKNKSILITSVGFVIVGCISLLSGLLLLSFGYKSAIVQNFGLLCGFFVVVAAIFQYTPQIFYTFKTKKVGSLSLLMLIIQCPGNFLVVLFQVLYSANFSTWLPFLVAGIEQIILICQIIYYDYIFYRIFAPQVIIVDDSDEEENDGSINTEYIGNSGKYDDSDSDENDDDYYLIKDEDFMRI